MIRRTHLYYNSPWVCLSVGVRKLQVAILARSSREMFLTVRIVWQYILSRVCISVRSSNFFIREKHPNPWGNRVASACVYLNDPATGIAASGADGRQRIAITCTAVTAVCVCVHTRVHACVRDVFAICDNKIWPRLIMIIIKIIILYFIQIRHTDEFPSTGTRLVILNLIVLSQMSWY